MPCCVLIAGLPASGKTTFAAHLAAETGLPMVSKDRLKELMYDNVGFRSHQEKVSLSIASTEILYYFAESLMRAGLSFILENNFENLQKPALLALLEQYAYRSLTVRFGGDIRVIYQRYLARDGTPGRHRGHSTHSTYPEGDAALLAAPPTLDEFIAEVESRGIGSFSVGGEEILVDATHFEQLRYEVILRQVHLALGPPPLG